MGRQKITVAREGSSPRTLEIRTGDAVQFINKSGSTAHVWFGENDAVRFLVEKGGSTMKFERPGTYDYTVHVTADKVHSHTGKIVVKLGVPAPHRRVTLAATHTQLAPRRAHTSV